MSPFENLTQAIGVIAFGIAAMSCLLAGNTRNWRALSGAHLIFAAEIAIGLRHPAHLCIDHVLQSVGLYAARTAFQALLLGALALCIAWMAGHFARWASLCQARRSEKIALAATILTGSVFCVEIISLHALDTRLYAQTGGVMCIAWLWLAGATIVAVCASFEWRRNSLVRKS